MRVLRSLGIVVAVIVCIAGAAVFAFKTATSNFNRPALAQCEQTTEAICDSSFTSAGNTLPYRLIRPENGVQPVAMMLVLHGANLNGPAQEWLSNGTLRALASRERLIIVLPSAGGDLKVWNNGMNAGHPAVKALPDHLTILSALVDRLREDYAIAAGNVLVSGFSNGGAMAMRMACNGPLDIAAVGTFGAPIPRALIAQGCDRPIPILLTHGTKDGSVKFNGGYSTLLGMDIRELDGHPLQPMLPAQQAAEFWRTNNACSAAPKRKSIPNAAPGDGTQTTVTRYDECESNASVVFAVVENGQHTVPGDRPYPFVVNLLLTGRHSNDYSGYEAFWSFASDYVVTTPAPQDGSARGSTS
ncbi:MAG: dienelactone hydrolase family protein [Pseudomonadota bacterium]